MSGHTHVYIHINEVRAVSLKDLGVALAACAHAVVVSVEVRVGSMSLIESSGLYFFASSCVTPDFGYSHTLVTVRFRTFVYG